MADASPSGGALLDGRYRLDAWIGGGAMGDVYLAEDALLGRACAIKLLNERHREHPEARERFLREASAAQRLHHAGIVEVLAHGEDRDGRQYLVMELLRGETLDHTLEREGRLSWPLVLDLALQLADALHAAHQAGVVHRDLKPSNCFLVRDDDGRERVKILDFGLAKLHAGAHRRELTTSGARLGTLRYMAPEQAADPSSVDHRADLYSLGVILFKLLTGVAPVDGEDEVHFIYNLVHSPPRPLTDAAPARRFPPGLERVLGRALPKRPDDRFADAHEFAGALRGLDGEWPGPSEPEWPDGPSGSEWPHGPPGPEGADDPTPTASPRRGEAFADTALADADSTGSDTPEQIAARTIRQIHERSTFFVRARETWVDAIFPLPGRTRLVITRGDLCLAREDAIVCPIDEYGPAPRSRARRVCEFGGPRLVEGLKTLRTLAGGHLYAVDGGRLAASRVLFAVQSASAVGLVRLHAHIAGIAAHSLALVDQLRLRSLAVPMFWGAFGMGRQFSLEALAGAFARALLAAPCRGLEVIRLIVDDTGEQLVRSGGEVVVDLSAVAVADLDRTQRFVLGRHKALRDLGAAIWSAIPNAFRPAWSSYGTRWFLHHVQAGRPLDLDHLDGPEASAPPAAFGLKHGARLRLVVVGPREV